MRDSPQEGIGARTQREGPPRRTFAGEPIGSDRSPDVLHRFVAMSSVPFPRVSASSWGLVVGATLLWALSAADGQRPAPPRPVRPLPRPAPTRRPVPPSLGIFQGTTDVGRPSAIGPGVVRYEPRTRSYVVTGGGANMWGTADHFRYLWIRMSGDVALEATVRFTGTAPDTGQSDPHRKACLVIRQSLDSSAAYADAATHGDGLTSLQWRDAPGAVTHEVQSAETAPARLRVEKRGDYVSMFVGADRSSLQPAGGAAKLGPAGEFYVGLAVSAHDTTRLETATFSDVRLERLAPVAAAGAVISTVETISLRSKDRRVAAVVKQATPVSGVWWYPDSARMLYFRGAWEEFDRVQADLPGRPASPTRIASPQRVASTVSTCTSCATADTGRRWTLRDDASRANPRLELSWIESASAAFVAGDAGTALGLIARWATDGSALAFASLKDDQIYVVRARSREPIKLTTRGHNADPVFSPDGRYVYFASDRTGRWQLWRQGVQGAAAEQLTHDEFENTHPYLSPDGRSIAFLSFERGATDRRALRDARLRRLSLADGAVEELAKLVGGEGSLSAYPWAPDGQHLAFVSYQRVSR
jgi:hypothetical protein